MKDPKTPAKEHDGLPHSHPHGGAAAGAGAGAASGAIIGSFGGPIGAVAGALIGAGIGAATGEAISQEIHDHDVRDKELDDQIGVTSGDLGAADPNQPPASRGTYSMGAAGGGSTGGGGGTQDAGPIPRGD